jgi:hypothetical protein
MKPQRNITDNNTDLCIGGAKHSLVPARQRANKVRFRCTTCTRLTGWQKQVGTVKAPVTNDVSKEVDDNDFTAAKIDKHYQNLKGYKVPNLRAMLIDRNIVGGSKMNKQALIDAIMEHDFPKANA